MQSRGCSVYDALLLPPWDFEGGVACLAEPASFAPADASCVATSAAAAFSTWGGGAVGFWGVGRVCVTVWGEPAGGETSVGLSWPLDTAGLIKGAELGYTGGAAAQRAVSH